MDVPSHIPCLWRELVSALWAWSEATGSVYHKGDMRGEAEHALAYTCLDLWSVRCFSLLSVGPPAVPSFYLGTRVKIEESIEPLKCVQKVT